MKLVDEVEDEDFLASIPNSFQEVESDHFPLIITYDKLLTIINNSIGDPFPLRLNNIRI